MRTLLRVVALGFLSLSVQAQQQPDSPETQVRIALTRFVTAFDSLDWDRFQNSFTDDATVFYPRAVPQRAEGREQFETGLKKVLEQMRGHRTAPPYMRIEPKEVRVHMLGNGRSHHLPPG